MKVEQARLKFKPITITLETEEEANLLRWCAGFEGTLKKELNNINKDGQEAFYLLRNLYNFLSDLLDGKKGVD